MGDQGRLVERLDLGRALLVAGGFEIFDQPVSAGHEAVRPGGEERVDRRFEFEGSHPGWPLAVYRGLLLVRKIHVIGCR